MIVIDLTASEAWLLGEYLATAEYSARLGFDEGQAKVSIDRGTWTVGIGREAS